MIDPSIRARLDEHIIAAQAMMYRTVAGGKFEITPTWARGYSGLGSPAFNIFLPLTPAALTDDILADTAAFFSSKGVLYSVELIHDRLPAGPDFLTERRYQPLPPQPAMYLAGPPEAGPLNGNVEIQRVTTVPTLTAFCTLMYEVFDFDLFDMVKFFPVTHFAETKLKNVIRHYVAFVDEKPVGAATIICLHGVASIWNVCTADEYRRQGVASTLLRQMLSEACDSDCELTMLYSTPLAYHLFSKLGFDLYAQRQWFLPPGLDYEDENVSLVV